MCHCLLIESSDGLVLVDTGIGLADVAAPEERLGRFFLNLSRPQLRATETAAAQVEALGFARSDVRHIVLTHAHLDHAGGLADFPAATVHLYADEHVALSEPLTVLEHRVYRKLQWAHRPHWAAHVPQGDRLFGFEAVRPIPGLADDIALLPLPGHTRGHAAVAVHSSRGWLLHAGDAYFHHRQIDSPREAPIALCVFERTVDLDVALRKHNLSRLRELKTARGAEVEIFCSHDPVELEEQQRKAESTASMSKLQASS